MCCSGRTVLSPFSVGIRLPPTLPCSRESHSHIHTFLLSSDDLLHYYSVYMPLDDYLRPRIFYLLGYRVGLYGPRTLLACCIHHRGVAYRTYSLALIRMPYYTYAICNYILVLSPCLSAYLQYVRVPAPRLCVDRSNR